METYKATNWELSTVSKCLINTPSKTANEKFDVWTVAPFCMKQLYTFILLLILWKNVSE